MGTKPSYHILTRNSLSLEINILFISCKLFFTYIFEKLQSKNAYSIDYRWGSHRYRRPGLWYCASVLRIGRRLRVQEKRIRNSDCQVADDTSIYH
jgi:hypothetical protein